MIVRATTGVTALATAARVEWVSAHAPMLARVPDWRKSGGAQGVEQQPLVA